MPLKRNINKLLNLKTWNKFNSLPINPIKLSDCYKSSTNNQLKYNNILREAKINDQHRESDIYQARLTGFSQNLEETAENENNLFYLFLNFFAGINMIHQGGVFTKQKNVFSLLILALSVGGFLATMPSKKISLLSNFQVFNFNCRFNSDENKSINFFNKDADRQKSSLQEEGISNSSTALIPLEFPEQILDKNWIKECEKENTEEKYSLVNNDTSMTIQN